MPTKPTAAPPRTSTHSGKDWPILGYLDGRNVAIEGRFAEGQYDRLPTLIAELLAAKVDVLAVTGAVTARAVKKAATGLPIVFAVVVDPVADGVVADLEHPGGTSLEPPASTRSKQGSNST